MTLEFRTSGIARWFLDDTTTLPPDDLREVVRIVCEASDPYATFAFDTHLNSLPDAAALTDALHSFAGRVVLLASQLNHEPEQSTAKLLSLSQTVSSALVERLRKSSRENEESEAANLKARVSLLTAIQQVNNAANSTLDLEQVLDLTAQTVTEVLQLDECSIYLFDESINRLTLRATTGLNPLAVGRAHFNLGQGVAGWAAEHGEPVALENAREDPRYVHNPELMDDSLRSLLSVPIILYTVNKLIGVLNLQTRETRTFASEEIRFAETVCGQIAIAIENARLYAQTDEKLREKVNQLTTLQRVGASIASSLDLEQVLEMIARHAAELSGADKAAIFQLDDEDRDLYIVAGHNLSRRYKSMRVDVGDGAVLQFISDRSPLIVEDVHNDSTVAAVFPQLAAEGVKSMFCVPLIARDRVLGGIWVLTMDQRAFSAEQIELVSTFAYDAALTIENARLYQEAQRALETQAVLMREMQHRVKNNLQTVASLLSLQKRRAESSEAADLLGLSAARVQSIAAVHELFSTEDIGLATVGEIGERIMEIVLNDLVSPSQRIDFTIDSTAINLGSKQATLFALVLNELVSNAVMHGFAGQADSKIRIAASEENGVIAVDVWDSGIGMQEDFSLHVHAGLGLSIVEQLVVHELSGTFHIENEPNGGTTARITFPAESVDFWTTWWKD